MGSILKRFTNHQERLVVLNNDAENKLIIDIIDRPIRNLVLEINRIGLQTNFSCCGFSYRDEEEPKSHSKWPFVLFKEPDVTSKQIIENFFLLAKYAVNLGWKFGLENAYEEEWGICYLRSSNCGWKSEDGLNDAIHDHELKITAIHNLTKYIIKIPTLNWEFTIKDANEKRIDKYNEWLVVPKKESKVLVTSNNEGYIYKIEK